VIRAIAVVFLLASVCAAYADDSDSWESRFVGDAVVSGGLLWVKRLDNSLESSRLDGTQRRSEARDIGGMVAAGAHLWVWAADERDSETPTAIQVTDARSDAALPPLALAANEYVAAVVAKGDFPIILSNLRVFSIHGQSWREQTLSARLRPGYHSQGVLLADMRTMYVGFANGEWGGALYRVDTQTGVVHFIERRDSSDLCAGLLNASCDPVNRLLADSENPHCVLAAIGLAHLTLQEGRVLRVCGDNVSIVFERQIMTQIGDREFLQTSPIYGLARSPSGFWAITHDRALRIENDRVVEDIPIAFTGDGLLRVMRPAPELVVVSGGPPRRRTIRSPNGRSYESIENEQTPLLVEVPANSE
jgi:hypothetical protein